MRYIERVIALLAGCTISLGGADDDADTVHWSGFVYASPDTQNGGVLGDKAMTVLPDGDGAEAITADEPYADDYPGYYDASVPPDSKVTVQLNGGDAYPTVWRGTTPSRNGRWLSGALFGADREYIAKVIAALPLPIGVSPSDLDKKSVVHVWGSPLDAGWDCASVRVAGQSALCFAVADDGSITRVADGEFDWFFAFDIPVGEIVIESGLGAEESYSADAGTFIMAHYFLGTPP